MLDAGAVPIGKANCDEFAMGSSCENSALGVTRNPYDLGRVPGGSSGGSAAAVAAYEAAIGLGSDTGGSIREPGAFCNLVGFKPTYGRVSRYGLIAFASSLDQIGPLARTVEDAALAYDAMAGYDLMDATSIDRPVEPTARRCVRIFAACASASCASSIRRSRATRATRSIASAYRDLERFGAELVEVSLPTADYGLATYYLIAPAECSSNLARFDGVRYGLRVEGDDVRAMYDKTRAAGFGPEVKRRILIGTHALSSGYYDAYYVRAQKARTLIARDFETAFASCDLIACPAASCPAFEFNAKSDPYSMYLMDYYTIPMSLAGLPALSVPCGWVTPDGATPPAADRLAARAPLFAERLLLGAAHAYERATNHALAHKTGSLAGVRKRDAIRSRHRHRVSRRAQDADEDVLRLPQRVRRRAEHEGLSGLSGHARRAAGAQRNRRSSTSFVRGSPSARRFRRSRSSIARTTSIRTCPRTTRSRSTTCR